MEVNTLIFIRITAHFIDQNYNHKSNALAIKHLQNKHSTDNITEL